jgi:DNA-binding NtrC family response regulator
MVLLVEDNEDLLELLSDSFTLSGIQHVCASSLESAIETFQKYSSISMLITDLQLKSSNSYPLIDIAHEKGIAVTIVSGSVDGVKDDYQDKVSNIFFKPFDIEPFLEYIQKHLESVSK